MNPFDRYADILRADYGGAVKLQALVMHLFNPANPVDMGAVVRLDSRHSIAAFEMLHWYAENGENDPIFMEVARDLVEAQ